jgi:hypothetical protein
MDSMSTIPTELLAAFRPSEHALLDVLRQRVDEPMMEEIASADYGLGADEALCFLRQIRHSSVVPIPMDDSLKEVVGLTQWSEPDDPNRQSEQKGLRGHTARAFSCAILLRAAADSFYDGYIIGENHTVAQLVASALALGENVPEAAARFLAWSAARMGPSEERPFFLLALLVLAVSPTNSFVPEDALAALSDWLVLEESYERAVAEGMLPDYGEQWLLGLTFYNMRHNQWRSLARFLGVAARCLKSETARSRLEDISSRIAGQV